MAVETEIKASSYDLEQDFANSSLAHVVEQIYLIREGARVSHGRLIIPGSSRKFTLDLIYQDPQFQSLWQRPQDRFREYTKEQQEMYDFAKAAYASFLNGDAYPGVKAYATLEPFRKYIGQLMGEEGPGPYFIRTIQALDRPELNEQILGFVLNNTVALAGLDYSYFWLQDRKKPSATPDQIARASQMSENERVMNGMSEYLIKNQLQTAEAAVKFRDATHELLDTAYNPDDQSKWRQFVLSHFGSIYLLVCHFSSAEYYDPQPELARIKRLVAAVDDWDFLAEYLLFSDELGEYDERVLAGDIEEAKTLARFYGTISDSQGKDPKIDYEYAIVDIWVEQFKTGAIDREKLLSIPGHLARIRAARSGLPPELRKYVSSNIAANSEEFDLTSDEIFDSDIAARLYHVGLYPNRRLRDRLRIASEQEWNVIARYADSLKPLSEPLFAIGHIILFGVDGYLEHRFNEDQLVQIARNIRSIRAAELQLYQRFPKEEKDRLKRYITMVYQTREVYESGAAIAALLERGILHTEKLIALYEKDPQGTLDQIDDLLAQRRKGYFNPDNELQRELEFTYFVAKWIPNNDDQYTAFAKIGIASEAEVQDPLSPTERMEAACAAYEAGRLFWFINERVQQGRQVDVIGNKRYGAFFVVDPLRDDLQAAGVRVSNYGFHVHSGSTEELSPLKLFPEGEIKHLIEVMPDVVIVDGTKSSFVNSTPRFSRATARFLDWFLAFNAAAGGHTLPGYQQYLEGKRDDADFLRLIIHLQNLGASQPFNISFWHPNEANELIIGEEELKFPFSLPGRDGPEVIFANSVIGPKGEEDLPLEFKGHNPGFFDDPDDQVRGRAKLVFTKDGLTVLYGGRTEEEYVEIIQEEIGRALPRMLRRASGL